MEEYTELTDGLIMLRPYRQHDVDSLYTAVRESISEISPWMPWCHDGYSIEESRQWIASRAQTWQEGRDYDFTIIKADDGLFLGGCGLNHLDLGNQRANLGYWVRSTQTRRSVATKATLLLAQFGFDKLKLNRIEILIAADNKASQRVAEKVGATREGILRQRIVVRDKVYDAVMYSLLRSDLGWQNTSDEP